MKIINGLILLVLFVVSASLVQAKDYTVVVAFDSAEDGKACTGDKSAKLTTIAETAVSESGYAAIASQGRTFMVDVIQPHDNGRRLGCDCLLECQQWPTWCWCCSCCHGRRLLRVNHERELQGAADEVSLRVEMLVAEDPTINCVKKDKAYVTLEAFSFPRPP